MADGSFGRMDSRLSSGGDRIELQLRWHYLNGVAEIEEVGDIEMETTELASHNDPYRVEALVLD